MRSILTILFLLAGLAAQPIGPQNQVETPEDRFLQWMRDISAIEITVNQGVSFNHIDDHDYLVENNVVKTNFGRLYQTLLIQDLYNPIQGCDVSLPNETNHKANHHRGILSMNPPYGVLIVTLPFNPKESYYAEICIFSKCRWNLSPLDTFVGVLNVYDRAPDGSISTQQYPLRARVLREGKL